MLPRLPVPLVSIIPTVAAAALLTACAGNPATGGADIVLMSEYQEISIGKEMHEKMMESGAAYPDKKVQAYIDKIGQDLAAHSDRPKLKYTFTVIDNEAINAFALPGGYIYMNRGLMTYLDNEPELAAWLLERAVGLSLPPYESARLEDVTLTEAVPTRGAARRAAASG